MKPTIYDVASKANVSISTVSKVINEKGHINDKTKQRIYEAIKELDYKPSVTLSVQKAMKTIGLIIPDVSNPFMAEVTRAVEDSGRKKGLNIMICSTDNDPDKEEEYINMLQQKYLDGIIVATGLQNTKAVQKVMKDDIPVVVLTRDVPRLFANAVTVDDFLGGYQAGEHLAELGHTDVKMIVEDVNVPSIKQRLEGFKEALHVADISFEKEDAYYCSHSLEESQKLGIDLLSSGEGPTAVFASTDIIAVGVLQAAKALGIRVPEELSVIGFDNSIIAQISNPQLTTIAQPAQKMGEQVIELFQQLLSEKNEETEGSVQRISLAPKLIQRESTAAKNNKQREGDF